MSDTTFRSNKHFTTEDFVFVENLNIYGTLTPGIPPSGTTFQGTNAGFVSGSGNTIQRFPFAIDSNATDFGDMSYTTSAAVGHSSQTHGYTAGGTYSWTGTSARTKFPFAISGANGTNVGNLAINRAYAVGHTSPTHGYTARGTSQGSTVSSIEKFLFSSDATSSLTGASYPIAGNDGGSQNSTTDGYTSGVARGSPVPIITGITKFPFASDTNATQIGQVGLSYGRYFHGGNSSTTTAYHSGGYVLQGGTLSEVVKWPFASDSPIATTLNLSVGVAYHSGQSSTASGYISGGSQAPLWSGGVSLDRIQKFPFASDTTSSEIGNLIGAITSTCGQQD